MLKIKFITRFEGVAIYESPYLGSGFNSAGLALPGWGIVVGKGTYSQSKDYDVVRHEFGHFLQCRMIGFLAFYICVGIPSLISAWTNGWKKGHQNYWTEGWANELAMQYFGVQQWPIYRFPPKSPSKKTLRWIKWGI